MEKTLRQRLADKCIRIYERKRQLQPVRRFLDRLEIDNELYFQVLDEDFVQEARRQFFPEMTMASLLDELLVLYRSKKHPSTGVSAVWWRIDNEVPLSCDEYMDLTPLLTKKLNEEPNPPSKADWDDLEEDLMK